jgi:erythromycin esterase
MKLCILPNLLLLMRIFLLFILPFLYLPATGQLTREINPAGPAYQGLSFLDTLLQGKRIVLLGESSHGTEQYSQTKFELIRYLHDKLGYKVLLFEAPMSACSYLNMATDTAAGELLRNSVQSLWHTETVRQLFSYAKTNGMLLGGFDPQFVLSRYPRLFYSQAVNDLPVIKETLLQLETRVAETFRAPGQYIDLKDSFSTAYKRVVQQMDQQTLSPLQQWVRQLAFINSHYYANINRGEERDSCMAKNIIWLAENLYKNEKIIVWAHNTHIDKNATAPKRLMGKALEDHFKDQLYAVGLYMVNGTTALNDRHVVAVKPPMKGSLEELLLAKGLKTAFAETDIPAFNRPINVWHWGIDKQRLTIHQSFDAVILVDGVGPPTYLEKP